MNLRLYGVCGVFIFLFLSFYLVGSWGELVTQAMSQAAKGQTLKVVNYNIWHGLGGGFLKMEELEPPEYKRQRYKKQMVELKEAQPDVLFLQEVNPVSSLAGKMADELSMSHVFQNTNCGISLFGWGLPTNLDMGIAILVRPPMKIKKIVGRKLSGPPGFCNPYLTFQYAEFRYALFALASHPQYGSFLLVNTHFHHGVEWSPKVQEQIHTWEKQRVVTGAERSQLEGVIESSNERRAQELRLLFSQLDEIQEKSGPLPIIFAGDLNVAVRSDIYKEIVEVRQMKDSMVTGSPKPYTWIL